MEKYLRLRQQGDVLLKQIASLPSDVKAIEPKVRGVVLAEGETTGHAHCIADTKAATMFEGGDGKIYLSVSKPTTLTHEEHGHQTVPSGIYEIGIVQEYDYDEMAARSVAD